MLVFSMTILVSCGDKVVLPTQLPPEVQAFVQKHFPTQAISYAEKDRGILGSSYDVVLNDGTEISFDTDHVWDKVDCKLNAVPTALVPAPIATHVSTNFPSVVIVKIDKEHYGYEVELGNGLEMKFNKQGALTELDD